MASKLVPKKFLCKYELRLGATVYGILMCFVMLVCVIAGIVDMLASKDSCEDAKNVKRSAYAFSILIIIYSVLMLCVHIWFLWAVKRGKASVVLVWVATTTLWLAQTTILTVILLCLYIPDASFLAWLMCLIFGIIAFVICVYGVLIGYGLWLELKGRQRETPAA